MEALWTYAKHLAPYKCFGMPGETTWWPIAATQHTEGWEGRRRRIMSSKATWATLWVLGQPRLAVRPFSQETGLGGRAVGWKNPGRSSECSPRFLLTVWSYNGSKDPYLKHSAYFRISQTYKNWCRMCNILCNLFHNLFHSSAPYSNILGDILGMKYTNADFGQWWQYMTLG